MNKKDKWSKKNFAPMARKVITYHFTMPALYELSRGNFNFNSQNRKADTDNGGVRQDRQAEQPSRREPLQPTRDSDIRTKQRFTEAAL